MSELLNPSELMDFLGVSEEEAEAVREHYEGEAKRQERAEREKIWRKQRLKKFTSSEDWRLMTGADETKEEAIERIAKGNEYTKETLLDLAEASEVDVQGKKFKKDIVEILIDKGVIIYGVEAWPAGAETYVIEKVIEELTEEPLKPELFTSAILHGKEYEEEAARRLMKDKKLVLEKFGADQEFIDHTHPEFSKEIPKEIREHIGCTPDAKVRKVKKGAETKCPDKKTHFDYKMEMRSEDKIREKYAQAWWQMQGTMYRTDWNQMLFESYDPRFKNKADQSLIIEVSRRKQDIMNLEKRLKMAVKRKGEIMREWIQLRKEN